MLATAFLMMLASSIQAAASDVVSNELDLVDHVDGTRIMSTVADLQGFGGRAYFQTSMWNASVYIHDRFAELGLWVSYQDFQVRGYSQRNVVAVLNGSNPDAPAYLFGAHYDSITLDLINYQEGNSTLAPGADDDASGVAATIELATVLHDRKFNGTVKFVAFAAEETGLNGSAVFVQDELAHGVVYTDTVIMDMIGYRVTAENKAVIFRDDSTNSMAESVQDAVDAHGLNISFTYISGKTMAYSDHYPFWVAGYPSMLVIEELVDGWPVNPYYHSENDTIGYLSEDQMTSVTKAVLGGFLGLQDQSGQKEDSYLFWIVVIVAVVAATVMISLYIIMRRRGAE